MYKAVAEALVSAHKNAKTLWLVSGKSEQEWVDHLITLEKQTRSLSEPDYP